MDHFQFWNIEYIDDKIHKVCINEHLINPVVPTVYSSDDVTTQTWRDKSAFVRG